MKRQFTFGELARQIVDSLDLPYKVNIVLNGVGPKSIEAHLRSRAQRPITELGSKEVDQLFMDTRELLRSANFSEFNHYRLSISLSVEMIDSLYVSQMPVAS